MTGSYILAGLLFVVALLLFFPLRIRIFFVGAKKDSLIEVRFFKWTFFSKKADTLNQEPAEEVTSTKGNSKETLSTSKVEDREERAEEVTSTKANSKETLSSPKVEDREERADELSSTKGNSKETLSSPKVEDKEERAEEVTNTKANSKETLSSPKVEDREERAEKQSSFEDDIEDDFLDEEDSFEKKSTEDDLQQERTTNSKKRKLSEKEFLTLMFNPKLHSMVLRMAWKLLRRTWLLFKIRFEHTVVQGIRMEYDEMGVLAAISSFFTSQVDLFKNWDFQMDWLHEKEPEIKGVLFIQFRLFFLILWSLITLFYVGRVYFWYRRNKKHFIENPLPFRLVFWRRKIVDLLANED